jgi:hypothetical protein
LVRRVGTPDEYTVHHQPHHSWTLRRRNRVIWQTRYELYGCRFHPDGYWISAEAEAEEWSIPRGQQWQRVESVLHPARRAMRATMNRLGIGRRPKPVHADWLSVAKLSGSYRDHGKYIVFSCPAHEDRNPSCSVYPDRFTTAKCHSCGERWTVERLREAYKEAGSK